jgi:hypothetical protein
MTRLGRVSESARDADRASHRMTMLLIAAKASDVRPRREAVAVTVVDTSS